MKQILLDYALQENTISGLRTSKFQVYFNVLLAIS